MNSPLLGLTGTAMTVMNMNPHYGRVNPTHKPFKKHQTYYTSAGHLAAGLHMLLFSFGKPQNKYVSPLCTRAFLHRTLYQSISVPEVSLAEHVFVSVIAERIRCLCW